MKPEQKKELEKQKKTGLHEGLARAISQACVYSIESQKTVKQLHRSLPVFTQKQLLHRWVSGTTTSCITAGIVFSIYFSIYNNLEKYPFAGCVSSFVTSFIKLPIGNSMRIMHSGASNNILAAGKKLYKKNGIAGLYNGYGLCLIEDIIDIDLRVRLYKGMTEATHSSSSSSSSQGNILSLAYGSIAGAISTGITNPFDTIRSHMCFHNASNMNVHPLTITKKIFKQKGIGGFYTGAGLRISSNAIKHGLFFLILNSLS
jgi:hypothetical protein